MVVLHHQGALRASGFPARCPVCTYSKRVRCLEVVPGLRCAHDRYRFWFEEWIENYMYSEFGTMMFARYHTFRTHTPTAPSLSLHMQAC